LEVLSVLPKRHFIRPWASDYTKRSVNASEAELSKYASNIFGYIKVTFGNILADICHALNLKFKQEEIPTKADYENVREIISADLRIGPSWLNIEHGNYCGVGGYCFPKDMNAFISFAEDLIEFLKKLPKKSGVDAGQVKTLEKGIGILRAARAYNEELLKWQGLSTEDVAKHEKEIIIRKRKQIRIHPQNRQKR
jgi:hypothetical protein